MTVSYISYFYQACEGKDMSTKGVWIFVRGGGAGDGGIKLQNSRKVK